MKTVLNLSPFPPNMKASAMIKHNCLTLRQYFLKLSSVFEVSCFSLLLSLSTVPFFPGVVEDFVFDGEKSPAQLASPLTPLIQFRPPRCQRQQGPD